MNRADMKEVLLSIKNHVGDEEWFFMKDSGVQRAIMSKLINSGYIEQKPAGPRWVNGGASYVYAFTSKGIRLMETLYPVRSDSTTVNMSYEQRTILENLKRPGETWVNFWDRVFASGFTELLV